jgi:hypothetical protein
MHSLPPFKLSDFLHFQFTQVHCVISFSFNNAFYLRINTFAVTKINQYWTGLFVSYSVKTQLHETITNTLQSLIDSSKKGLSLQRLHTERRFLALPENIRLVWKWYYISAAKGFLRPVACIINLLRLEMMTLWSSINLKLHLLMTIESSFTIVTCL